jgi:CheY-like chemotaxis protein
MLSSELERGTRADLYLPVAENVEPAHSKRARATQHAALRPLSILLVDDEDIVRTGTAEMIRDLGHEVAEAASGGEALAMLAKDFRPDAVVTDYKMPRMDGAELSRRLQAEHPGMPILIITGYTGTTDDVLHLPRLAKPFGQAEVAAALASLFEESDNVLRFPGKSRGS